VELGIGIYVGLLADALKKIGTLDSNSHALGQSEAQVDGTNSQVMRQSEM